MYNNCFLLTGVSKNKQGKQIKKAMYIKNGKVRTLYKWDPKNDRVIEENLQYYQMTYQQASDMLNDYFQNGITALGDIHDGVHASGDNTLKIGIWLEEAKWDGLSLLCVDFDRINGIVGLTPFFEECLALADFHTKSQNGGYHCWFGINRAVAEPLFEEINLTTHKITKSFVCSINLTSNGEDKFDIFCENGRIIHEHEEWNPNRGVTDKTLAFYEMVKRHVEIEKKRDIDYWEDAEGKHIVLEGLPEEVLLEQMNDKQKLIFENLKSKDSGCTRDPWFWVGCNIKEVFGEELGGSVWLWWSRRGENYQAQACVNAWGEICRRKTTLRDYLWDQILETNIIQQRNLEEEALVSQTKKDLYLKIKNKEANAARMNAGLPALQRKL